MSNGACSAQSIFWSTYRRYSRPCSLVSLTFQTLCYAQRLIRVCACRLVIVSIITHGNDPLRYLWFSTMVYDDNSWPCAAYSLFLHQIRLNLLLFASWGMLESARLGNNSFCYGIIICTKFLKHSASPLSGLLWQILFYLKALLPVLPVFYWATSISFNPLSLRSFVNVTNIAFLWKHPLRWLLQMQKRGIHSLCIDPVCVLLEGHGKARYGVKLVS